MARKKIWAKGGGVTKNFDNGGSVLNIYIDIDDAIEKGFVRDSKQGKRILSVIVSERAEASEYGDTHSLYRLATPEEEAAEGGGGAKTYKPAAMAYKPATAASKPAAKQASDDDLPF